MGEFIINTTKQQSFNRPDELVTRSCVAYMYSAVKELMNLIWHFAEVSVADTKEGQIL